MTPGELIERYNGIRRTRLIIEGEHEEALAPYKEAEKAIALALLEHLNENNLQNVKSEHGTAYKVTHVNTKLVDRAALIRHCVAKENFDFFTNLLAKETVKAFVEENKAPPPGVEVNYSIEVNIRKS